MSDINLIPPIGTLYFKSYQYSVSGESYGWTAVVNVTFYVYVTLVKPTDPNFTANGGKVYIIAVYSGSSQNLDKGLHFSLVYLPNNMSFDDQLPIPGSEVKNGDIRTYPIDFSQGMNMYSNGGNSNFIFNARYKRSFSLTGYIQSKYYDNGWTIEIDRSANTKEKIPTINGIQIYESNNLVAARCRLSLRYAAGELEPNFDTNILLDFSAKTMADAIVGGPGE
ncbi:hypothetical protein APHAL10511_000320 [Amanita phalloides]|nr:hypothetical protein APHAL10511_000320 [Amanita phalloides]